MKFSKVDSGENQLNNMQRSIDYSILQDVIFAFLYIIN